MPRLEIQHRNGSVESVELSTETPLLIGSNLSSDIYLDAPGVAAAHCRVRWLGDELEVTAATPAGVVINGKTVPQGTLQHGGMLRLGDVNIVFLATGADDAGEQSPSESIHLKPTSEEVRHQQKNLFVPTVKSSAPGRPPEPRPLRPSPNADEAPEDTFDALYQEPAGDEPSKLEWLDEELEEVAEEVPEEVVEELAEMPEDELEDLEEGEEVAPVMLQRGGGTTKARTAVAKEPSVVSQVKSTFRPPMGRRSQRDPMRSPLVMILGGALGVLALLAGIIYFIVARQQVAREFEVAKALHEAGNYGPAIEALEAFAEKYPNHDSADEARVTAARDRVSQHLVGTVPDWAKGLGQLNEYVKEFASKPSFKEADSPLRQFVVDTAKTITLGSLETARTLKRRPLLDVSDEARRLFEAYLPEAETGRATQVAEMQAKRKAAEDIIQQNEAFLAGAEKFDAAFKAGKNLAALDEYRRLLFRYEDFKTFRPLQERLTKALNKEKELVEKATPNKEALTTDHELPTSVPPLSLTRRSRTRSDEAPVGTTVFALAADCAFGVDSVTGQPVWRRPIGINSPFFPVRVTTGVPCVLVFDTRYNELSLLEERTGKLQWRQPLDEPILGAPLVVEGQIFASGKMGTLFQVDLNTGKLSTTLKFSQTITGAPAVSESGERLYVTGNDSVLYALTRRPLGCERAIWIGHGPGAISSPLLMMKNYLLIAENDRLDSCRLRLLDTARDGVTPSEILSHRVQGHVRSPSILRGKQLYVPSDPEMITAFTVAEGGDARALVQIAKSTATDSRGGPMFLAAGPDDQLWGTATLLRKYQLVKDSLLAEGPKRAVGLAAQPLQMSGESLFVGRHPFHSRGVLFSEYERGTLTGQWQVALGGQILEAAAPSKQSTSFVCVTSLGDVYQITPERLAAGGFEVKEQSMLLSSEELEAAADDPEAAFHATQFSDGQIVVRGGKPPKLFFLGSDGTVSRQFATKDFLQANPIQLAAGTVLPLPGRLSLVNKTTGAKAAEDLIITLGQGGAPFRWVSLTPMDDTQFIALTDAGQVLRVQFRAGSPSSLAIVSQKPAERAVNMPLVVGSGRVVLTDNSPRVILLDANDLSPLGERTLDVPAAQAPWILGDRVFVDVGSQKFACFDAAAGLKPLWEVPLAGASVSGSPLQYGDTLLVVLQDGRIMKIDPSNGKVQEEGSFDVHERVTFGPREIGNSLIIGTLNGSLYTLSSIMQKGK